jgi:hypothetical protein
VRTEDQVALVRQFMLRIAPVVVRHTLARPYLGEEAEDVKPARMASKMTLEIASHMAAQFASFEYEALDEVVAQNAPPPDQQLAAHEQTPLKST